MMNYDEHAGFGDDFGFPASERTPEKQLHFQDFQLKNIFKKPHEHECMNITVVICWIHLYQLSINKYIYPFQMSDDESDLYGEDSVANFEKQR